MRKNIKSIYACELLKVSEEELQTLVSSGEIEGHFSSKRGLVVDSESLLAYLKRLSGDTKGANDITTAIQTHGTVSLDEAAILLNLPVELVQLLAEDGTLQRKVVNSELLIERASISAFIDLIKSAREKFSDNNCIGRSKSLLAETSLLFDWHLALYYRSLYGKDLLNQAIQMLIPDETYSSALINFMENGFEYYQLLPPSFNEGETRQTLIKASNIFFSNLETIIHLLNDRTTGLYSKAFPYLVSSVEIERNEPIHWETPISQLGFKPKVEMALKNSNITTLGELAQMTLQELTDIEGIGFSYAVTILQTVNRGGKIEESEKDAVNNAWVERRDREWNA